MPKRELQNRELLLLRAGRGVRRAGVLRQRAVTDRAKPKEGQQICAHVFPEQTRNFSDIFRDGLPDVGHVVLEHLLLEENEVQNLPLFSEQRDQIAAICLVDLRRAVAGHFFVLQVRL